MKVQLGGDRIGSGNKMEVELKNYERSTHNLGYLWRSSMSSGTLPPFLCEVGLPGDTWDIDLTAMVNTLPTIGPLFGSYKLQLDVYLCPVRLYIGALHNNKLGIGMKMQDVKLPILKFQTIPRADGQTYNDLDNAQINSSCLLSYLGIRGIGFSHGSATDHSRTKNGLAYLSYWDIYKNYYANKQEELGAVIHNQVNDDEFLDSLQILNGTTFSTIPQVPAAPTSIFLTALSQIILNYTTPDKPDPNDIIMNTTAGSLTVGQAGIFTNDTGSQLIFIYDAYQFGNRNILSWEYSNQNQNVGPRPPRVQNFTLSKIDDMREAILAASANPAPFDIIATGIDPYILPFETADPLQSMMFSQEGLGVKTYQSDLFNNWLTTDWIDGAGGINEITAVSTTGDKFEINALVIARKVYDILNRIYVAGGSYEDWINAVWDHKTNWRCESPMYMGGLIKEVVFQEVISNSESAAGQGSGNQPLGTLAGKGMLGSKHKGGHVTIKCDEHCYIIGIVSLTPRIDYSQGNKWDTDLATMDDFKKPGMDEIGFQESINEYRAWWTTKQEADGTWVQTSAGKVPAWLNYMTNTNQVRGNFAIKDMEMFMVLNRRYEPEVSGVGYDIKDLTTYIDPSKMNYSFAQTSLDSQNFWVQLGVDITARRKMSAKLMPNL